MTALLLSLISLVAVFCVMNTLLVLTVQKTPEIGLLKAIGFRRFEIMKVFMVHGMIQCGAGIVLGLCASWAVLANLQNIVELPDPDAPMIATNSPSSMSIDTPSSACTGSSPCA